MKLFFPVGLLVLGLVVACRFGSMPGPENSGKLPVLDGSSLTNLNAATLNGAASSETNVASTIPKRDSTGSINTNVNGSATYAMGKKGSEITAAANLNLPVDGSYFNVTGTASIQTLGNLAAGTRVTLRFADTGATLVNNQPGIRLHGSGPYTTVAGDLFEFISFGDSVWREVNRKVTGESLIAAGMTGPRALTHDLVLAPILRYDQVTEDRQGEYNPTTGIVTFKQSGTYQIEAGFASAVFPWLVGDNCIVSLVVTPPGSPAYALKAITSLPAATIFCDVKIGAVRYMQAGTTLGVLGQAATNSGPASIKVHDTELAYHFLHVAKVQ